ncbi:MAG: hypothetical protein RLZZ458_2179 [Planctomycetota bacterium]|jgi:hypothetical protein
MRFPGLSTVVCLLLLNSCAILSAHEGHGSPAAQHGILHYVVNPSHLVPFVVACAAAIWTTAKLLRKAAA